MGYILAFGMAALLNASVQNRMIRRRFAIVSRASLAIFIGALLTAPIGAAAPAPRAHFALVIGNATYAHLPNLPGCSASAHLVTATLARAGFTVSQKLDQTNGEMSGALATLADAVSRQPMASVIVYICGYAMEYDNRAFLLPVSAVIDRDSDVLTEGLVAKSVIDVAGRSGTPSLVLLDSVAKPNSVVKLSFASVAGQAPDKKLAVAAASAATAPPEGASPFATALSNVLASSDIEAGIALKALQQRMGALPGVDLSVLMPSGTDWPIGGPATAAATAPSTPFPAGAGVTAYPDEAHMTGANRRQIQTALLHLGYYDGRVDGIFGADTRAAIRRFQHEIRATMTGEITPAEAVRLLAEGH